MLKHFHPSWRQPAIVKRIRSLIVFGFPRGITGFIQRPHFLGSNTTERCIASNALKAMEELSGRVTSTTGGGFLKLELCKANVRLTPFVKSPICSNVFDMIREASIRNYIGNQKRRRLSAKATVV